MPKAFQEFSQDAIKVWLGNEKKILVSGPRSKIFQMSLKVLSQEKDKTKKIDIAKYLIKNVIHPYGYSLLSYLTLKGETQVV